MDVRLPDGTIVRNVPEGTTRTQLMARFGKAKGTGVAGMAKPKSDLPGLFLQGATFGLSDELSGIAGALTDAVAAPFSKRVDFNPKKSYEAWRDRERERVATTRKENPWVGTGMELLGGITNVPAGAVKGVRTLKGAIKAGAKAGALSGAVAGFGYGEGGKNSAVGSGLGAVTGGVLGAAIPAAARAISRPITAARDYVSPRLGVGREIVGRALRDDQIAPSAAASAIQSAQQNGVPLALMDLGDNLRGLAGSLSRKPGPSRTLIRSAVEARQAGQGERVRSAIERDLGPIANPLQVSDALMATARRRVAPLYDQAYSAPVIATPELDALLGTPAGRGALSRARTIAANERRDPTALGFVLDDEGNVVLNPTVNVGEDEAGNLIMSQDPTRQPGYTTQTLDYVKRGLDDTIEAQRDQFGRLRLDEAGRAINGVRAQLLNEMDRLNPAYAQARAAYAGPASANQAMLSGQKALNASGEELERMTARMSDADRQQFALGFRAAMAEALDRRVDGGDKVTALLGTPRKRAALGRVFGGEDGLDRFVQTMANERAANETYRTVAQGSPTARFLADDAITDDNALLADVAGKALKGAGNGGLVGAGAELLNLAKDRWTFGGGVTGQRAREDAAALLSEIDPDVLQQAMRDALRQQALRRAGQRNIDRAAARVGGLGGRAAGAVSAYGARPVE